MSVPEFSRLGESAMSFEAIPKTSGAAGRQRGKDVSFPITITDEQASLGFTKDIDLSFQLACLKCGGKGGAWTNNASQWFPCSNCQFGIVTCSAWLQIEIPPGTQDGHEIRLPGKGGPGENGCPAGDCICMIRVIRQGYFADFGGC
jgi:DnaJ-class molecular chaperone